MLIRGSLYLFKRKEDIIPLLMNPMMKTVCFDMDETSDELMQFGNTFKSTILLPPANVMFTLIDGNIEQFRNEYESFLHSDVVCDFMSAVLYTLYSGVNAVFHISEDVEDDSIWLIHLLTFLQNTYGLHVGTSVNTNPFIYDERYDLMIVDLFYYYNIMNVFEYMIFGPYDPTPRSISKLSTDLILYFDKDIDRNILDTYHRLSARLHTNPNARPGIMFEN